jgi:RNA polymerase sigma factor (sigma-70 family)
MSTTGTPTDIQATRAALEALLPDFQGALSSFLFSLLHHHQTTEDALQETLLKALLAIEKGTGHLPPPEPEEIKHWLYCIARNTAIDLLRHQKRKTWIPLSLTEEQAERGHLSVCLPAGDNGDAFEDDIALRELIEQALEQLPADYADCLRLFALDEYSCREIALRMQTRGRKSPPLPCAENAHCLLSRELLEKRNEQRTRMMDYIEQPASANQAGNTIEGDTYIRVNNQGICEYRLLDNPCPNKARWGVIFPGFTRPSIFYCNKHKNDIEAASHELHARKSEQKVISHDR